MSLQPVEQYAPVRALSFTEHVEAVASLAVRIAATGFVPTHYRDKPDEITAVILWGDEIGLQPMQSLRSVIMVNGNPGLKAEAMRALVLAAGHEIAYRESTSARCSVAGRRRGSETWHVVTWDAQTVRQARLGTGDSWQKYPRAMLKARATAELCRDLFPDVIGGVAAVEELSEPTEEPERTRRVRRTQTPPDASRPTDDPDASAAAQPSALSAAPGAADASGGHDAQEASTVVDEPVSQVQQQPTPQAAAPVDATPPRGDDADAAPGWPMTLPSHPLPKLGGAQRNLIMRLWQQLSISDRDERLALTSVIVQRHVDSTNDLTAQEASDLIDTLDAARRSEHPAEVIEGIKRLHGLLVDEPLPLGDDERGDE